MTSSGLLQPHICSGGDQLSAGATSLARCAILLDRAISPQPGDSESCAAKIWREFAKTRVSFDSRAGTDRCSFVAGYRRLARIGLFSWQSKCQTFLKVEVPAEKCLLWLPIKGGLSFRCPDDAQSQRVMVGLAGIMPALADTQCRLDADSWVLALAIPQAVLIDGVETLARQSLKGYVAFERAAVSVEAGTGKLLCDMLEFIVRLIPESEFGYAAPIIGARLEEAMVLSMLSGLPHNFTDVQVDQEVGAAPAPGLVRRAELYIHSHADENLTISDIAGAVGYSVRSIQMAFRRFRNTTPMAYLRRVRLEYAYEELLHARPATTIASVASHWHFSHHGRFSVEFRRRYGETPGEVLHRGRRR